MKNKKVVIIILLCVVAIYYINNILTRVQAFGKCSKEGEMILMQNSPDVCCLGLSPISGIPDGYKDDCSLLQPPGGLTRCADTRDGVCDKNNGEGKCNSPNDCRYK